MTDLTTTNLKRLLDQATPGPWEYMPGEAVDERCIGKPGSMTMCIGVEANGEGSSCGDADLTLAAAAPEITRELLILRDALADVIQIWQRAATDPERTPIEQNLAARVVDHIKEALGDHDE